MARVVCEIEDQQLRDGICDGLRSAGHKILLRAGRKHPPDYHIVFISSRLTPQAIRRALPRVGNCEYIVVGEGQMIGEQMSAVFSGHTLSYHDSEQADLAEEICHRIADARFLASFLARLKKRKHSSFALFADSVDEAVSVLDRSFRCVYRNQRHRELTRGRDRLRRLCWLEFRGLTGQGHPCKDCPSLHLFECGSAPPGITMVGNKEDGSVLCTRLHVFPLKDPDRGRIVASIEMARELAPSHAESSGELPDDLLDRILVAITQNTGFTRARVLAYAGRTRSLRGLAEHSTEPSGRIGRYFKATALPYGKYNTDAFERPDGLIRMLSKDIGALEELPYLVRFKKLQAPIWAEYALHDSERMYGKLVVDKYDSNRPPFDAASCDEDSLRDEVLESELPEVLPYAQLLSDLLPRASGYLALTAADELADARTQIVRNLFVSTSEDDIMYSLVRCLPDVLNSAVSSAFIRIPDYAHRELSSSRFGTGKSWRQLAMRCVKFDDSTSVSAAAFTTRKMEASAGHEDARLTADISEDARDNVGPARASVPLLFGPNVYGILAVQGGERLLDRDVLDVLQDVADVAGPLLWIHQQIRVIADVDSLNTRILRWFGHDATGPFISIRDTYVPKIARIVERSDPDEIERRLPGGLRALVDFVLSEFQAYGFIGGASTTWQSEPMPSPVEEMLETAVAVPRMSAPEMKICIQVQPSALECRIDRLKTIAIVYNLVTNAVAAIDRNGGASGGKIEVSARRAGEHLRICVQDNGCGFSADERMKLFLQGYSTDDEASGTGLFIVQRLVQLAKGQIRFDSDPGVRTYFEIDLRLED